MDLTNSIASASMTLSAAQTQMQYSTAVTKKVMDSQELAMQGLLEMLPQQSAPAKGAYIDTYA